MMTINEIRHANVRMLVRQIEESTGKSGDRSGALTAFAARLGKTQGQASHFAAEKPTKAIGDKIAREIEIAFDKERGWMDWAQWDGAPLQGSRAVRLDAGMIVDTVTALRRYDKRQGRVFEIRTDADAARFVQWYSIREQLNDVTTPDNLIQLAGMLEERVQQGATSNERGKGVPTLGAHGKKGADKKA